MGDLSQCSQSHSDKNRFENQYHDRKYDSFGSIRAVPRSWHDGGCLAHRVYIQRRKDNVKSRESDGGGSDLVDDFRQRNSMSSSAMLRHEMYVSDEPQRSRDGEN